MSAVAPRWRFKLATDWLATVTALSVVAVDEGYTYSASDEFLDDVSIDTVGDVAVLPSPAISIVSGAVWLQVDDDPAIELEGIPAETDVTGLWVFDDTGVESTSRLVAFITHLSDTTPLAFRANGGTYLLTFPGGWVVRL